MIIVKILFACGVGGFTFYEVWSLIKLIKNRIKSREKPPNNLN